MKLKDNEVQYFDTYQVGDNSDIKTALQALQEKIEAVTRQVTFWDVYNITQVLLSESDMVSKIAQLNAGEAAIVNANMIQNGSEIYYRGDVIYKMSTGDLLHIPAENKGVYQPSIEVNGNQITVTYTYTTTPPEEVISNPITISNQDAYLVDVNIAGTGAVSLPYTFTAVTHSGRVLTPVIKFYYGKNNSFEEFYPDYNWTTNGTTITVTVDLTNFSLGDNVVIMRVR